MKRLLVALAIAMSLAGVANAATPHPQYVAATTFAAGETINLEIRGKQTGLMYASKYITVACTQNVYVSFDATEQTNGFYTATETDARDGSSADHEVSSTVYIPANTKISFKGHFTTITSVTASTPGTFEVWAEYGD